MPSPSRKGKSALAKAEKRHYRRQILKPHQQQNGERHDCQQLFHVVFIQIHPNQTPFHRRERRKLSVLRESPRLPAPPRAAGVRSRRSNALTSSARPTAPAAANSLLAAVAEKHADAPQSVLPGAGYVVFPVPNHNRVPAGGVRQFLQRLPDDIPFSGMAAVQLASGDPVEKREQAEMRGNPPGKYRGA